MIPFSPQCYGMMLTLYADSLVSSQVYEIVKTVYSTTANETTEEGRIKVLQSTLGQLRLNNIATLDALMTHFTRLIELTSADETYVSTLAQALSPCILRPRFESTLTMNERHSYRLIRDLFEHKDAIFGELKRQSSASAFGAGAAAARPRAISTDESNRRAAMEARNRAIASRSRATSPAHTTRHRRDRSTDGSIGRFPINVGSPQSADRKARQSLDVPNTAALHGGAAEEEQSAKSVETTEPNGATTAEDDKAEAEVTTPDEQGPTGGDPEGSPPPTAHAESVGKRDSLNRGRNVRRAGGSHHVSESTDETESAAAAEGDMKGVTLEDKPMEDFA
jgi:hypothetical protein